MAQFAGIEMKLSQKVRLLTDPKLWPAIVKQATEETAKRMVRSLSDKVETLCKTHPTGDTKQGIDFAVERTGRDEYQARVGWLTGASGVPFPMYVRQLNYGGWIPKAGPMPPGKFLVFEWNGTTVFAKRVFQEGRHFIEAARQEAPAIGKEELGAAIVRGLPK